MLGTSITATNKNFNGGMVAVENMCTKVGRGTTRVPIYQTESKYAAT